MAKIIYGKQVVNIVNISEDETASSNVTQYPVENGAPISDHSQITSKTVQISGYILKDKANEDYKKLLEWKNKGRLVTLKGRIYLTNVVITDVSKTYSNISNGFGLSITLIPIRIAKTSWSKIPNSGKKQPTAAKNKAVYVTVKRGDTYWGWWKKYGTSIQTLRNWNKWPDRFIPIGKRARVK